MSGISGSGSMGSGERRRIQTNHVKAWMLIHGFEQKDVARATGYTQQMISLYVRGKRGSDRLTQWFLDNGCPDVFLPRLQNRRVQ